MTLNRDIWELLNLLTQKKALMYLVETMIKPQGIREIAYKHNISLTGAYHIAKRLQRQGLIEEYDTKLTQDGKRYTRYHSTIEDFRVETHGNKIVILIKFKNGRSEEGIINSYASFVRESEEAVTI